MDPFILNQGMDVFKGGQVDINPNMQANIFYLIPE